MEKTEHRTISPEQDIDDFIQQSKETTTPQTPPSTHPLEAEGNFNTGALTSALWSITSSAKQVAQSTASSLSYFVSKQKTTLPIDSAVEFMSRSAKKLGNEFKKSWLIDMEDTNPMEGGEAKENSLPIVISTFERNIVNAILRAFDSIFTGVGVAVRWIPVDNKTEKRVIQKNSLIMTLNEALALLEIKMQTLIESGALDPKEIIITAETFLTMIQNDFYQITAMMLFERTHGIKIKTFSQAIQITRSEDLQFLQNHDDDKDTTNTASENEEKRIVNCTKTTDGAIERENLLDLAAFVLCGSFRQKWKLRELPMVI